MESALLGLVLDSSAIIGAERRKQPVTAFIEGILTAHGPVELSLSPVTLAELVHGTYRAQTPEAAQRRREYIEEFVDLLPVHPVTKRTAWLVGRIEGQEAAKGNGLPFNDLMIAAAALGRRSELKAESWRRSLGPPPARPAPPRQHPQTRSQPKRNPQRRLHQPLTTTLRNPPHPHSANKRFSFVAAVNLLCAAHPPLPPDALQ